MVEIVTPSVPPFALAITSWIYVAIGLSLGVFGRVIWGRLMTLIGIILGAAVGYSLGALILPGLVALALAIAGAALGGMLFTWIVEVALAAMAGALGLYVTYRSLLDYLGLNNAVVAGLLVMLIVFSMTFYYMQRLLSYVTGLMGGVLTGVGLFLLTGNLQLSVLSASAIGILGTLFQELVVKRHEGRIRKAMKRRPAAAGRR